MSVLEVCSHEIVCVEDSVAPVAAGEKGSGFFPISTFQPK